MESLKRLILSEKGVSPVIGTILMVAVTVVMAAIIGGFVYQMARPQEVPNLATSLVDDARVIQTDNTTAATRVAKLTIETGDIIATNEVVILATYTAESGTEYTVTLDGTSLTTSATAMGSDRITVTWVDSDSSGDLSPGDRLDFKEGASVAVDDTDAVMTNTDFTVKITHKSSKATISNHTIKVY